MQSKKFFVEKLCRLRHWNTDDERSQELYNLKIVELLVLIKLETPLPIDGDEELYVERFGALKF